MTERQKRLVEENHNLIYFCLKKYDLPENDFYDIAAIGLIKAAKTYKEETTNFSTYAVFCIGNEIKTEYRNRTLKKVIPSDKLVRADKKIGQSLNDYYTIIQNGNENLEEKVCTEDLIKKITRKLDDRRKQVLVMLIDGYNMSDIASAMGVKPQRIFQLRNDIKTLLLKEMEA